MNKNFVNAVKNSGITPYRLSKYSGVPYTIISELLTGKKDINKRAADTVLRLAKALNLEISDIMNPVYVLDGVSGKYKGVSYRWKRQDDYMILSLKSIFEMRAFQMPSLSLGVVNPSYQRYWN